MNRNLLKWILIAAVILGAAGYLVLSETSSNNKKEKIVVGHSKPFKIEPVEGITISAPKNALDKNREFKLTPVDDKTYEKVVEQLQGQQDVKPLMVFELDAGLKPDAFLPGNYHVEIDLDQIGIPRSLQEKVVVYRGADYDRKNTLYYMYDARLNNGKFSFKSNQNSKLVLGLRHRPESSLTTGASMFLKNPVRVFVEGMSTIESLGKIHYFDRLYFYFANPEDHISILVKHESGDFRLHFLFSDTEDSNRFYKYLANDKAFGKRIEELEQEAHLQYEAKVQVAVNKQGLNDAWWDIFSKKQVDAIRERINEEEIFDELVKKDLKNGELAKLQADPDGKLPKSIETIIHQIIRANEFLNASGFSSSNTVLQVALMKGVMDAEGTAVKYWFEDAGFVNINYSSYFDDSKGPDAIQCTLVHELCHIRQKYYYAYFKMSRAGEEATAVVLERDAAKLWYKQGILGKHHDPESRSVVSQLLTARPVPYIFGYPIDKLPSMDDDKSYTMADAIEGIREGVGKDDVTMSSFLDSYLQYGPSAKGWKDWIQHSLAIDDGQFRKGWVYFAERLIPLVFESQCGGQCPKEVTTTVLKISRSNPVAKLERLSKPQDYTINTFRVNITDAIESTDKMPSVFVHCKTKGESNPYVTFYWSDSKFQEYLSKKRVGGELLEYTERVAPSPNFVWNCATDFTLYDNGTKKTNSKKVANQYQLATVTTTQSEGPKGDYRVVALFPPEKLKIRKAKEDQITFIVPKAPRALTKEKLITGAVVTYKDNKGNVVTRDIQPKDFGRKATWSIVGCTKPGNGFSLSMHWYYRVDEQTVYESPESEPVTWGSKGDQPEEETRPIQEPKTNYWKQVGGRMKTENTSIDKGESIDDEEVSSDYRSIELQAAQTGRSLDFTGMGATEEKTKEKGRVYVQDIFIEGTLTYTEPPKFWIPTQQYKAHWEIADDPYLTKVEDPFVFEAKNTSSDQAACAQSKKDKIDNGRSPVGKANWLRGAYTTFEARHPEKNGPKSFTLTQTYSIKERQGSDLMATVTFVYNYEWVGEEEPEPEVEEETVPEGGYWQLVKTEVDDSKISAQGVDKNLTYNNYIEGKDGVYLVHGECGYEKYWKKPLIKVTHERTIKTERPKKIYTPGETIRLKIQYGATKITPTDEPNAKNVIHGHSVANFDYGCTDVPSYQGSFGWEQEGATYTGPGTTGTVGEDCRTRIAPTKGYGWTGNTFLIIETVRSSTGNTVELKITYHYEWVDGGKKAKPVKESAKEKPISGGHWKLALTSVVDETASYTSSDGEEKIQITGSNGHYSVHAEYTKKGKTYCTMDREINFEKPKSTYKPEEILKLEITNEKVKLKGKPEYGLYPYGEHIFSNFYKDDYSYDAIRNPKKVVSTTSYEVSKKNCSAGTIGFSIHERARFGMAEVRTNYLYEWVD